MWPNYFMTTVIKQGTHTTSHITCTLVTAREMEMVESFLPHQMSGDYLWDYFTAKMWHKYIKKMGWEVTNWTRLCQTLFGCICKSFSTSTIHSSSECFPRAILGRQSSISPQTVSPVWGCITLKADGSRALQELFRETSPLESCPHQAASHHHLQHIHHLPSFHSQHNSSSWLMPWHQPTPN